MVMLRKLNAIYPLHLEIAPLFLLVFAVYLTLANYSALPDTIPTHFNLQGVPDGWGGKNEIFIFSGLGVVVYALITGISLAIAVSQNPLRFINLPVKIKQPLAPDKLEELRGVTAKCLFGLKTIVLGLNSYLLYHSLEVAFNRASGFEGYWMFIFVAVLLILVGILVYKSYRIALSAR